MNDVQLDYDEEEPDQEFLTDVSTFEALMIQALVNQATSIVEGQHQKRKISYQNQLMQAQALQSLAQTALMLTDAETIFLHGGKLQNFINRAYLEHTLGSKSHVRTANNAPRDQSEIPTDDAGEGKPGTTD